MQGTLTHLLACQFGIGLIVTVIQILHRAVWLAKYQVIACDAGDDAQAGQVILILELACPVHHLTGELAHIFAHFLQRLLLLLHRIPVAQIHEARTQDGEGQQDHAGGDDKMPPEEAVVFRWFHITRLPLQIYSLRPTRS